MKLMCLQTLNPGRVRYGAVEGWITHEEIPPNPPLAKGGLGGISSAQEPRLPNHGAAVDDNCLP
jgi:hypothetical protein